MAENFPNERRENITPVQEAQKISIKKNPKRPTPRQTIKIAILTQRENLKAAIEKEKVAYNGGYLLISQHKHQKP